MTDAELIRYNRRSEKQRLLSEGADLPRRLAIHRRGCACFQFQQCDKARSIRQYCEGARRAAGADWLKT